VGAVLLQLLASEGVCGIAVGRQPITGLPLLWRWQQTNLEALGDTCWPQVTTLVGLQSLWLLPALLAPGVLPALHRVVAVGSTSLLTKQHSADEGERQLSAALQQAEAQAWALATTRGLALTILRPTMLYGVRPDRHLALLARCIGRFGCLPLPGPGAGLRQPLHAADLAMAIRQSMPCPATFGRTYTLYGGETLPYRAMVERLFAAQGRKPRIVQLSPWLLRLGFAGARLVPRYRHLQPGMLLRLEHDQTFDCRAAREDFGFAPRPFEAAAVAWQEQMV
jgi:nucleoside-diphosphate-sugar epimerase